MLKSYETFGIWKMFIWLETEVCLTEIIWKDKQTNSMLKLQNWIVPGINFFWCFEQQKKSEENH